MDNLNNFNIKEEVYKCSKCGLCKSVCPIFLATRNELYISRGRYIILNKFFNENTKFSNDFIRNFDFCLNCNRCKDFCPSNIDFNKIAVFVKSKYNYKFSFFKFSKFYFLYLNILRIIRFIYIFIPFKSKYFSKLFYVSVKRKKIKSDLLKGDVLLFDGCFNKYINPSDKNAAINIIKRLGYNVKSVKYCCGYPYLSDGDLDSFKTNMNNIIKSVNPDTKYIICTCDTCFNILNCAHEYLQSPPLLKEKLITLAKFLEINNISSSEINNANYFKTVSAPDNNVLDDKCISVNKKGSCTFMENFLFLKYPNKIKKIINSVYDNFDITSNEIITTCQISKWGLIKGFDCIKKDLEVYSLSEFIEKNTNSKKYID